MFFLLFGASGAGKTAAALSACLIGCDDETRIMRLRARGPEWLDAAALRNHLGWARWMRRHAQDPAWRVDVIKRADPAGAMRWERWSDWQVWAIRGGVCTSSIARAYRPGRWRTR